jgi:DNA-binding transcriptional LysR family regulator
MSVSFDAYKVFYVTVKNESITAAAKELYVTQPTVTHCIQKLEEDLGCVLFIRGKKGVELTPGGKILYHHVAIACEQIWIAENEMNQLKEFKKGEIALGASETTLHHFLFPYLKKYKQKYPNVRLKIHNSSTPSMLDSIRENKLDCGILVFPLGYKEEGIEIKNLVKFQDIVIVGKEYKELAKVPVSLKDLVPYPIIGMGKETMTNQMLQELFKQHHLDLKPDIELATTDLIVPTVANDLGIGFVPEAFAKEALIRKEIFQLDLLENIPQRSICLVYKVGKPQSIAVEAFMDSIKESV